MEIAELPVEKRDTLGTAAARRMRRAGRIPCVLYGHGQETVSLVIDAEPFDQILKAQARIVRLKLGEEAQAALIRDVEWNLFGDGVNHVDFVRVELEDEVEVTVPLHYVGTPAGALNGGVLEELMTDLEIRCRVDAIPSEIKIDISALKIGDGIHVRDVGCPEGVRPARGPGELLVHVVPPKKAEEPAPAEGLEAEGAAAEAALAEKPEKREGGEKKERA